jgi:hypothetical protein
MATDDLIRLFEDTLPEDMVIKCNPDASPESIEAFNKTRVFMYGDAAKTYFDTFIRPVLARQIEMRTGNEYFDTDACYSTETLKKYMGMLPDDDELHEKFKKNDISNDVDLDLLKDFVL